MGVLYEQHIRWNFFEIYYQSFNTLQPGIKKFSDLDEILDTTSSNDSKNIMFLHFIFKSIRTRDTDTSIGGGHAPYRHQKYREMGKTWISK